MLLQSCDAESASPVGDRREHDQLRRRDVELRELAVHRVDQLDADAVDQPDDPVLRTGGEFVRGRGFGDSGRCHGDNIDA